MPTYKKALTSNSKPQLARHYESATLEVFGKRAFVPEKLYDRFRKRERLLNQADIYLLDYAERVLNKLHRWALKKGWDTLPINIFLGNWAMAIYRREIGNRPFTYIQKMDEEFAILVIEEHKLIQFMIAYNIVSDKVAAKELWPLMCPSWRAVFNTKYRRPVIEAAFQLHNALTGSHMKSYDDMGV